MHLINTKRQVSLLFVCLMACLTAFNTSALIMVGKGNSPVHDVGWPDGALAMANLSCRIGWWEGPPFGGGEWNFQYRGDTTALKDALKVFTAIRSPKLELVVHDGPQYCLFLTDDHKTNEQARVDWSYTVWHPESWHRLFNNPKSVWNADHPNFRQPVPSPRMDVYVGGSGLVDWDKVVIPPGIVVRDERVAASPLKPAKGALVQAVIYDMASGKPISGARLMVVTNDYQGKALSDARPAADSSTDASGLAVASVPAGNYRIWIAAAGYASRLLEQSRLGEQSVKQYTAELAKAVTVSGKVSLGNDKPIPGVKITPTSVLGIDGHGYTLPMRPEAETDEKGGFVLSDLPQGYLMLRANLTGYYHGDVISVYDAPSTNIVLKMTPAGSIRVTVTDRNGKPMSQYEGNPIMVEIEPKVGNKVGSWGGSAMIDATASYTFNQAPPGEYRITSHPNPSSESKKYAPTYQVTLEPGGQASVVIVYE